MVSWRMDSEGPIACCQPQDLPRHALEALAAAAYRSGVLTGAEVGCMLGLESRWEVEDFLKNAEALLGYTEADLSRDLQAIRMT